MYVPSGAADEPLLKSNMFSLGGAKFLGAVNRSINLGNLMIACTCTCVPHLPSGTETR